MPCSVIMRSGPMAWLIVTGIALVGCGSRTPLGETFHDNGQSGAGGTAGQGGATGGEGGATGGDGGATGGEGGGTGGTGGMGGSPAFCSQVEFDEKILVFDVDSNSIQHLPMLAPVNEQGSKVGVGVIEMPLEEPMIAQFRLSTFEPWQAWSQASLGQGRIAETVSVGADQADMARGTKDGTLAIVHPDTSAPPALDPEGLVFTELSSDDGPVTVSTLWPEPLKNPRARFLRYGPGGHMVGWQVGQWGTYAFNLTFLDANQNLSTYNRVGCASNTMVGDAAPSKSGFILAYSSSNEGFSCLDEDGPAHRINLGMYNVDLGYFSTLPLGFSEEDEVGFLRVIPHPDGIWLVYQYKGLNSEIPPPIHALVFSESGEVLDGPFSLPEVGNRYDIPGIAGLGRHLVFAWFDESFPASASGYIAVVGAEGKMAKMPIQFGEGSPFSASMSVLAAPSNDAFLVGWSERTDSSATSSRVRLGHFRCIGVD